MSATRTNPRGPNGRETYDDGVDIRRGSRWTKGDHDRIYPDSAKDGYVDLTAGEIVDLSAHYESGVGDYRMDFNAEQDALELVEVPRPEFAHKTGAEERVVATIPRSVF